MKRIKGKQTLNASQRNRDTATSRNHIFFSPIPLTWIKTVFSHLKQWSTEILFSNSQVFRPSLRGHSCYRISIHSLPRSLRFSASNASRVNAWADIFRLIFPPSWRSSNNETATTTLTALAPFDGNELLIKTLFIVKVLFFLFSRLCLRRLCARAPCPHRAIYCILR